MDAKTQEPLPFANVYINHTTIGTTTNDAGEFILKNLPLGFTEIVFSSIGYTHYQQKILIKAAAENNPLFIKLNPDVQSLSEVEIKSSRDKTWEKQRKKFEKLFLGNTTNCKILNPWAIDFSQEKNVFSAKAAIPIEIENRILGYKLFFQLKDFRSSSSAYSIVGNVRFTELPTSDATEALSWTKNREHAYLGSVKHVMKSILDRKINKNGFAFYREKVKGRLRSHNFTIELENNLAPYDTLSLVAHDSGSNEYRIELKEKMEVHYYLDFSGTNYYSDINGQVSWLEVSGAYVRVDKEGTILNPSDVAISGSMAEARVSSMLPSNYKPQSIVVIETPKVFSAKRLQEKVYVHTDKPYYYPGDKIWFSVYMNYRTPGLVDTLSKVLYVDLINIDRRIEQDRILKVDSGRAAGSFGIPAKMKSGNYILRAYTQWMRNYGGAQFFYKPITLLNLNDRVDTIALPPVSDDLIKITFDQPQFGKRAKVKMTLKLDTTNQDEVIKGSFSISVVDETQCVPVRESQSIKNNFELHDPSTEMLPTFKFPIERGISIKGAYHGRNGKGKKTKLTILQERLENIYQVPTRDNGEFLLKDLNIYDSTRFGIQLTEGKVVLTAKETPALPEKLPELNLPLITSSTQYKISGDTLPTIMLKEVEVKEKKTAQYENSYAQPDFYIKSESIETYQNLAAAIAATIPAYKLVYYETHWYILWVRGEFMRANGPPSEPALYVDQALVVGETAGDRLVVINPASIDHIEVKGMIGSNLGANGANGMISVFTKRYTEPPFKGLPIIKVRGFDRAKSFQSPNYDNVTADADKEDYRATLYWNPRVDLNSTHPSVELSFFTSDQSGNYRVIVEGVTNKRKPVHAEAIITVKN